MALIDNLKWLNLIFFSITGILFLSSAASSCWIKFTVDEKNTTAVLRSLFVTNTRNLQNVNLVRSRIVGKMNLLQVCMDIYFSTAQYEGDMKHCFSYNDNLPLPNKFKKYFTDLKIVYPLVLSLLILACLSMVICILLEIKKIIDSKNNNMKYYRLAVAHVFVAGFCSIVGLAAIIVVVTDDSYHMTNIYTNNVTVLVEKNVTSFLFWLAEGISILATLGCIAELKVWKRSTPLIQQATNNFENRNFDSANIQQENVPI